MKTILSIQSHVAYGYVGNRAAVFPLQLMGYEVITVNTVQFSNHTGYGSWTGEVFDPRHIEDVIAGIEERRALDKIDAVLTGYMGNPLLGDIILNTVSKIRKTNPGLIYCCDPVMGDTGRGFFVADGIPDYFKDKGIAQASVITPNQFELSYLSGVDIQTRDDAVKACNAVHDKGTEIVLITSLETSETKTDEIQMLVSQKDGQQWLVTTPKLDLDPAPNGAGDMTAALFLGRTLAGESVEKALQNMAASVFDVFEKTKFLNQRELAIIQAQDCFKIDTSPFEAIAL